MLDEFNLGPTNPVPESLQRIRILKAKYKDGPTFQEEDYVDPQSQAR